MFVKPLYYNATCICACFWEIICITNAVYNLYPIPFLFFNLLSGQVGKVSTNFAAAKNGKVGSNFSEVKNGQVSSSSKKR